MIFYPIFNVNFLILDTHGSSPIDWTLDPMDLYKSNSYSNRIRCNICRQFGHTGYNCKEQYKPEICIMCGVEGHNFHSCNKKICLSVSFTKIN